MVPSTPGDNPLLGEAGPPPVPAPHRGLLAIVLLGLVKNQDEDGAAAEGESNSVGMESDSTVPTLLGEAAASSEGPRSSLAVAEKGTGGTSAALEETVARTLAFSFSGGSTAGVSPVHWFRGGADPHSSGRSSLSLYMAS